MWKLIIDVGVDKKIFCYVEMAVGMLSSENELLHSACKQL